MNLQLWHLGDEARLNFTDPYVTDRQSSYARVRRGRARAERWDEVDLQSSRNKGGIETQQSGYSRAIGLQLASVRPRGTRRRPTSLLGN